MITKVHRNYLAINSLEELNFSKSPNNNCQLVEINPPDFQINKFFYKQVGNDHRWIDRLIWDDQKWITYKLSISGHPKLDDLSTYDHYQPVYKKTYLFESLGDLFQLTDNYYLDFLKNLILQENL